jgi:hypothetical protein
MLKGENVGPGVMVLELMSKTGKHGQYGIDKPMLDMVLGVSIDVKKG